MDEISALSGRALAWAEQDCDPVTAEQCRELAARADLVELRDYFGGQLEFGTAGLRAKVGPGPWRMNRSTVRRASRAVADHLNARAVFSKQPEVVVAFDARGSSRELAEEVCGTLSAAGVRVRVFAEPTPTPIAAFTLLYLRADAAIVITASHNPKEYNGFKLYGADGAQIVAPVDADVATRMDGLAATVRIPSDEFKISSAHPDAIAPGVIDAYFAALQKLRGASERRLRLAYTPLHGLGASFVERALAEAGFADVAVVASQREPHPDFPTVPFPNPEEPGVMNAVFELAERCGANLALATDPDVDRLAVGLPGADGRFVQLTGNQVGVLLADFLLEKSRVGGVIAPMVVQSVVSTPMLRQIAEAYGARCERTLTGFKWISRPAITLGETASFVFGFEEAIGYAVFSDVRDKDGISAALVMAELANDCLVSGASVDARLLELYRRHGLWVSAQHNVVLPGALGVARIGTAMNQLRTVPPRELAGETVAGCTDYSVGADERPSWLGKSNLLELSLPSLGRVLVRPSGTEPKLKIYVDVRGIAPATVDELHHAEAELGTRARRVAAELVNQLGLDG